MKRCMIVDDSSVIRKVVKRILTSNDLLVVEAGTGEDALAIAAHAMPEIILVDAALPDMASVDLIRQIAARGGPVRPQIILCLVEMDVGAIMRAKRAGAHGYLLKPFDRAQLLERLRQVSAAAAAAKPVAA
jgi:two-component system, chemotaxis family, chemotaxis protein CheY